MGFFGRLLDKWSKKDREDKEKERVEAKRQEKLAQEAEKKRDEINWMRKAGKMQLEDWKKAVAKEDRDARERKVKETLNKVNKSY